VNCVHPTPKQLPGGGVGVGHCGTEAFTACRYLISTDGYDSNITVVTNDWRLLVCITINGYCQWRSSEDPGKWSRHSRG